MTPEDFFEKMDREWFLSGAELFKVRLDISNAGLPYMTNLEVEDMAAAHCKYWGKKLKTIPKSSNLSASRWAKLGGIVRSMAGDLRGLPKAQALSLIRTRTGCSEEIMNNMTPDLRVWNQDVGEKALSNSYNPEEQD